MTDFALENENGVEGEKNQTNEIKSCDECVYPEYDYCGDCPILAQEKTG